MSKVTPEEIDAYLPQTQCGLCGYGGCMPYAEAMVFEQASINLCPPGGVKTLRELGDLLQQDPTPFIDEMEKKSKPAAVAVIREAECIGCTKCIQACPVDAIVGSAKLMHTVITDACTGCELCIPPCPVDCIDLVVSEAMSKEKSNLARQHFNQRQQRLASEKKIKTNSNLKQSTSAKLSYIEAALARVQGKKNKN